MANQLTNKARLPQIFQDAIQPDNYDPVGASDYSATTLIDSPRKVQLTKRHKDEIQEDSLDMWAIFRGNAVHHELEASLKNNPRYIVERKITRFDKPEGGDESQYRRVVAKLDAYDKETKCLSDHKTTNTFIHGNEMKPEWINQLNLNAYFLEKDGYPVKDVAINAIYMDWRPQSGRYKDDNYPSIPFCEFRVPAWPMLQREKFYKERLRVHVDAESLSDDLLPLCTPDECLERPSKFAVYKVGAAKATRLLDTREEAEAFMRQKRLGSDYGIEFRPGERTRCEKYCPVNKFCNQYNEWKKWQDSKNTVVSLSTAPVVETQAASV